MKKTFLLAILTVLMLFFSSGIMYSQVTKERIGAEELIKNGINYFNYSDKDKVNFEVGIWGYVKNPGKYLIPQGTTFIDLISLSGGPLSDAKLRDIRIVRLKNDSLNIKEDKVIVLNYSDFLQEEKVETLNKTNPTLLPGDIILIPGLQKSMFRENFSLILTAVSTIASVTVLLVTILKN
jgi:hypothetical protein